MSKDPRINQKLDPAALVPGQRVRLRIEGREDLRQDRVWTFTRSELGMYWFTSLGRTVVLIDVDGEGTLNDTSGRIVEVRDATE